MERRDAGKIHPVLIILGVVLLLGLLCGGGVVSLMFFGLNVFTEQVVQEIRDNPVIVEHIGKIEDTDTEWVATAAANDDEVFVFALEGTKGSGTVTVRITINGEQQEVTEGSLELPSGEVLDLFPDGAEE